MSTNQRPYVYVLVDPRDGAIFYVGKGRRRRAWAHERSVRMGHEKNAKKRDVIQSIIADGLSVEVRIVSSHATDVLAYEAEKKLVSEIGLSNLTNLVRGGGGYPVFEKQSKPVDWEYILIESRRLMKPILRWKAMPKKFRWVAFFSMVFLYRDALEELGEEKAKLVWDEYKAARAA